MTLDDYLQTIKADVVRARTRAHLEKEVRSSAGIETMAALVERHVRAGNATLKFYSMTGKKRDGLRLPRKPGWDIWSGDTGVGISRTAALYANFLLGGVYDFAEIEARVTAEYEKIIEDHTPPKMGGW